MNEPFLISIFVIIWVFYLVKISRKIDDLDFRLSTKMQELDIEEIKKTIYAAADHIADTIDGSRETFEIPQKMKSKKK